jgi:hypothetical protein
VGLRVDTWPLSNYSAEETSGPPRFLVDPTMLVPRSSTPVGHRTWLGGNGDAAFRSYDDVGPTINSLSRLNHAARALPVYASRRSVQHSVPAGCHPFAGRGWYPLGLTRGFNYMASSSSRLRLAHRARE